MNKIILILCGIALFIIYLLRQIVIQYRDLQLRKFLCKHCYRVNEFNDGTCKYCKRALPLWGYYRSLVIGKKDCLTVVKSKMAPRERALYRKGKDIGRPFDVAARRKYIKDYSRIDLVVLRVSQIIISLILGYQICEMITFI